MTPKHPFEAAQKIILSYLALISKEEDPGGYAQCIAAYRFLGAGAKVDKASCQIWLKHSFVSMEKTPSTDLKRMMTWIAEHRPSQKEQLAALLEVLPESEEEDKPCPR